MSTSLLCFLSSIILLTTAQQDELCMWGRFSGPELPTNGLYRRAGNDQANGKFYWKLDRSGQSCSSDYYWIYWEEPNDFAWYIGKSSTDSFGFGIGSQNIFKCKKSGPVSTPVDCGANWALCDYISASDPCPDSNIDANFIASFDVCPELDCASIYASYNGINACIGDADQTGINEYTERSGAGWVWWFNAPFFQWTCTAPDIVGDSCVPRTTPDIVNLAPVQAWQDLSGDGSSIVYDDTRGGNTGTFTCTGTGATYTLAPTTPNPTVPLIPTPYPTYVTEPPSGVTLAPTVPTTAPTEPTTAQPTLPTPHPTQAGDDAASGDDDDDDDDEDSIVAGLPDLWFWIIIAVLVVILCCCICACCYYMRKSKRKKKEDQFGASNENDW